MTSRPYAVEAVGLGKQYHIGTIIGSGALYDSTANLLRGRWRPHGGPTIWAVRDVSFAVSPGRVLGVLGRNGSGKSTLMKILARVTVPTEGRAVVNGRVGALLQVGAGFHPELTGRDNIGLSGAVLGMSREEISSVQDAIVEFAEIGEFLDTSVKHYSSGMFMRLAFSVSAHLRAEVMLVDEVLAVGDASFRQKCQQRIRELVDDGRTVLFVSHSASSIVEVCDDAIVLDAGRIVFSGTAKDSIEYYEERVLGQQRSR